MAYFQLYRMSNNYLDILYKGVLFLREAAEVRRDVHVCVQVGVIGVPVIYIYFYF